MTRATHGDDRLAGRRWFVRSVTAVAAQVAVAPVIAVRERAAAARRRSGPAPPIGGVQRLVTDDGAQLHVRVAGTGSGPTFVLTHGLCCDQAVWDYQALHLADIGRVVTWDLRGHGSSVLAPDRLLRSQLGAAVHADDLATVVASVPAGPVILAGHSLGGVVTLLALRDRAAVRERVAAVAMVATPSGDVAHSVVSGRGPSAGEAAAVRGLLEWLIGDPLTHYGVLHPRGASWLSYAAVRAGGFGDAPAPAHVRAFRDSIARTPPRIRRATLQALRGLDLRGTLGDLDVPALVVIGEQDRLVNPRLSRALAHALPDATTVTFPHAGHAVVLERHAEITRHLLALTGRALPGAVPETGRA